MDAKSTLSEILGYYKYKVENNLCTMEEIESATKALEGNLEIYGTTEDMANYFGVPNSNVRNVISRKVFDKPKRRVYYRFLAILKAAPTKWLNKNK